MESETKHRTSWTKKKVSFVRHERTSEYYLQFYPCIFIPSRQSSMSSFSLNTSIFIKPSSALSLIYYLFQLLQVPFYCVPLLKCFSTSTLKKGFHQSQTLCSWNQAGSSCALLINDCNTKDHKSDKQNGFTSLIFQQEIRVNQHKTAAFVVSF